MLKKHLFCFAVLLTLITSTPALAGWTVIYLSPGQSSVPWGVAGGQQVGYKYQGYAALWSGTAASYVNLSPAGASYSEAYGVGGGQQVGYVRRSATGNYDRASLWSGTAASWRDLHPAGYKESRARGVCDGQQVGHAFIGSWDHAGLWSGTAASWVDLNPSGFSESHAWGTSGQQQVGSGGGTVTAGQTHALLWTGTAASRVDLHPAGAAGSSALDVSEGQQVGYQWDGGFNYRACLWNGTAASRIDLTPGGCTLSSAEGVSRGWQCGRARGSATGNQWHAGVWRGTAASWVDLHGLLPADYLWSYGMDIDTVGSDLWVTGYAYQSGQYRAVLWHGIGVVPEPSSLLALGSGLLALCGALRRRK